MDGRRAGDGDDRDHGRGGARRRQPVAAPPRMDWSAAERRYSPETLEDASSAWSGAWSTPAGRSSRCGPAARRRGAFPRRPPRAGVPSAARAQRPAARARNFSDGWQSVDLGLVAAAGIGAPAHVHSTRGGWMSARDDSTCRPGAQLVDEREGSAVCAPQARPGEEQAWLRFSTWRRRGFTGESAGEGGEESEPGYR